MKRRIWAIAAFIVLSGCGGDGRPVAEPGAAPLEVSIPEGASITRVGQLLEEKHVIRSASYFKRVATGTILPGLYAFSPSDSPEAIYQKLAHGDVSSTKVTFPEGFTIKKMAAKLIEKGVLADDTEFLQLTQGLEGQLFPDTYAFSKTVTAKEIVQQLQQHFQKQTKGLSLTPEALIVASLIEREAETDEDRPKIAGVIYNRIQKNMRLQIDATVQYILPQHKARLLFSDLKTPSLYNTYLHAGLPPGPICSPGLASIQAALAPEKSNYLFYVQGEGRGHIFAKTFEEHRANIARVRKSARP
ncbi:endolytic transglycosylase MltG [Armatimonas sp.]|uniref:endolytic transglycosylase MltG n=1 Tax=Armatimonas sp. TaxID=1872638 RepID=UPI00286C269E|nr:endolytic transglycosylase MltG [Armatimonas sp.]